ncbi:hypothetical protein C4G74_RS19860 [Vibrio parahaemolyticus]|uniref:hypothetical protein n=1 Tax=Vibrio cidicii TaxID=1763883 RepID=UPI000780103A|nr:hypothetical protein [Vibrio cidicii]EHD2236678.1 hypothetical protein [Vibrio vulnificus]EJG1018641.1 hypothetical protein [Vibrio parahaemolyticus]EKA5634755.1 hypothetical protein [Vibrio navarrensis]EHZ2494700.1 hypothetical protein [Vibrio vulnificus]KYN83783.1 hypothetical protein ATY36_09155 [Vibrio cidicii]
MAEYDEKNQELYEENTNKIWAALDAIRRDKKLDATKAQLAILTQMHRNSFTGSGSRGWVSKELEDIKLNRKQDPNSDKVTKKQQEENLQSLLEQSKLEILHWFTLYSESERELDKLRKRLNQTNESLEWYKEELSKERKVLQERIELLESLVSDDGGET